VKRVTRANRGESAPVRTKGLVQKRECHPDDWLAELRPTGLSDDVSGVFSALLQVMLKVVFK
jgi:hypothetical protein